MEVFKEVNIFKKIALWNDISQVRDAVKEADMNKVKSGLKSTEFYLALIAAIVPVMNQYLGLNLPIEAIVSIAGIAIVYIFGRSIVKKGGAGTAMMIFALSALLFAGSALAEDVQTATPAPLVAPVSVSPAPVEANLLSNLSIDGYLLYSLSTYKLSTSPGITYNLLCAWDCAVKGNIGAVIPLTDKSDLSALIIGPTIDISLNNLIGKIDGLRWMTSKTIDFGIGILFDVPNLTHRTLKEVTYPTIHLKIINF